MSPYLMALILIIVKVIYDYLSFPYFPVSLMVFSSLYNYHYLVNIGGLCLCFSYLIDHDHFIQLLELEVTKCERTFKMLSNFRISLLNALLVFNGNILCCFIFLQKRHQGFSQFYSLYYQHLSIFAI